MFWGVTLESGKRYSQIVESSYHLSMAALEPYSKEGKKPNKYVSVMIEHGKAEFLLCTLEYDRVMQVALDLLFVEGEEVSFFLNGEGTVHLSGYVTDNEDKSLSLSDESDEESATLDTGVSRLLNVDDESESTDEEWTPKKASKEKNKLLKASTTPKLKIVEEKKLLKQNMVADLTVKTDVPEDPIKKENSSVKEDDEEEDDTSSSKESDEEMEDVDDESEDEESEESEDEEEDSDEESEDDEEFPSPSKKKKSLENDKGHVSAKSLSQSEQKKSSNRTPSHNEMSRAPSVTPNIASNKTVDSQKKPEAVVHKAKSETSFRNKSEGDSLQQSEAETESSNKSDSTSKLVIEDGAVSHGKKKKKKRSLNESRSSTEEQSFTSTSKQPLSAKSETPFKNKLESSNLQKNKTEIPTSNKTSSIPKIVNEATTVSTGKKKKKKRSHSEDKSSTEDKSFIEASEKDTPSSKLQGGIKATDVKQGHGPQAKKGRFVHICYVGRLSNGEEFDSTRDRPFSFRLGHGEVIKGLDTGIEGMKVGGKRKLVIPPTQGYGSKKHGPIPPNSTLQFEIELKAIS